MTSPPDSLRCVVVDAGRVLSRTSSIYSALPGQYRLKSYLFFFLAFLVTMVTILKKKKKKKIAHVLSWVKIYHHAEFQRNPPTGLAGMMVQTYRQTDRQILFFSQICHLA